MRDRTQGSNVYCFSRGGKKTAMVNWPRFSLNRGCCAKAISCLFSGKNFVKLSAPSYSTYYNISII